jgi:hypothetical protein
MSDAGETKGKASAWSEHEVVSASTIYSLDPRLILHS